MKNQLSPGVAIGAIVAVLAIAGGIYALASRTPEPKNEPAADASKGPPMPSDVQAEFQKRMGGGTTGPGARPGGPGGGGAPMMTGPGGAPMMTGPGGK